VVERLKVAATDLKALHEGSPIVQQLTWRPQRFTGRTLAEADPIAEMVLTFHASHLALITVIYDRDQTQGLTDEDMLDALSAVYGAPRLLATPTRPSDAPPPARRPIGRWDDADAVLILWREHPNRVGLTITAIASDVALQDALAEGVRRQAIDAPGREMARRSADAAAIQARDAKVRLDNKAKFKP
jgi:hypothetical protein